jgi:hypothetical protein
MLDRFIYSFKAIVFAIIMLTVAGCSSSTDFHSQVGTHKVIAEVGDVPERIELPQGWSQQLRENFWFTSQGSRILPYSWFTWLEQPNSQELFRDAKHFELLRYLPAKSSADNRSGLPIGFAMANDAESNQAWVGMTCAACHTNQIDYNGNKLLIEGAPTLGNFVLFYSRLVDALNQTYKDDAKFERFANKLLSDKYSVAAASQLHSTLSSVSLAAAERLMVNQLPEGYPSDFTSYGRLDAFANIQNAGTAFALHDLSNKNSPDGPVSYPFLWGTHQSDVVQWNASAPNTPVVGPLARNVGEVIGVFGDLSMDQAPWWRRLIGIDVAYSSAVDIERLGHLESWVKTLRSPEWPSAYFPKVDEIKAAKGAELFAGECQQCHQVIQRDHEGDKYIANKTPISELGTDPITARNADRHCAQTLLLEGTKKAVLFGDKFASETTAISIPVNGAIGVILNNPTESLKAGLRPDRTHSEALSGGDNDLDRAVETHGTSLQDHLQQHISDRNGLSTAQGREACGSADTKLVYKGRPLNGIWATAPYLHNGSVPTLWELLRKGPERTDRFWVGSREFDPVRVGFKASEGLSEFRVNDDQGQVYRGNSNLGHDYGTHWSDQEKWSVIEYMKTL